MTTMIEVRDREVLAAEFHDEDDEARIDDGDGEDSPSREAEPVTSRDTFGASW